jgi:hypothetical protein
MRPSGHVRLSQEKESEENKKAKVKVKDILNWGMTDWKFHQQFSNYDIF